MSPKGGLRSGESLDTPFDDEAVAQPTRPADEPGDEVEEDLPNAESLVAGAIALAGENLDDAQLVGRYWRFAPDEELIDQTPRAMLAAARAHRELATQR